MTHRNLITVYHGTKYMPSKCIVQAPHLGIHRILECDLQGTSASEDLMPPRRVPSVTAVLSATSKSTQLLKWQEKMIANMGLAGFKAHVRARAAIGTEFHSIVTQFLESRQKDPEFWKMNQVEERLSTCNPSTVNYVRSLLPFLQSLSLISSEDTLLETPVVHSLLGYRGVFDAAVTYKDTTFLIDWKTSSMGSSSEKVSMGNFCSEADRLDAMYTYPTQIAAYVGAFNADPKFRQRKKITNGAVVLASERGTECTVVEMNPTDLETHWSLYREHVHSFWSLVNDSSQNGRVMVDTVNRGV